MRMFDGGRALVLLGNPPPPDAKADAAAGLSPRLEYLEIADALGGDVMSRAESSGLAGPLRLMAGHDPLIAASLAAVAHRETYGSIYVTGEDIGLRLAPMLRLTNWPGRLVMVVHACTSTLRKTYLRALGRRSFHTLITVCEAQRRILIDEVGFPADRVCFFPNWVDVDFFQPRPGQDGGYVYSCGRENRDYGALFAAAAKLPHAFKVTASGFRHSGGGLAEAPANVDVSDRRISFTELRANYAGARFVVTPLHAVPYAAGVTGVVEAMAMGKAVITTASPGIMDYVEDGRSGRVVPPGDPDALAAAVQELWGAPERCAEMGRRNRAWVESNAAVKVYADKVAALMGGA